MSTGCMPVAGRIVIAGKSLETAACMLDGDAETVLLIHEALGSVAYWKDFPSRVSDYLQCNVVTYSRAGHGNSEGPVERRSPAYYRKQVEQVLPELLRHYGVQRPVLYGHSEGGLIALLYAATHPDDVTAVIAECPVLFAEPSTVETMQRIAAEYEPSGLAQKLTRYHRDADATFRSWVNDAPGALLNHEAAARYLSAVCCPVLVVQGKEDPFGTIAQFRAIQSSIPHAQHAVIPGGGHLSHRDQPELVLAAVRAFLSAIPAGPPCSTKML